MVTSPFLIILVLTFFKSLESKKNLGHKCSDDEHCADFSLTCSLNNTCICARFHHENSLGICNLNLTELHIWLESLNQETDRRVELDKRDSKGLMQIYFSGILVVGLGLLGCGACIIVFCVMHKKNNFDEENKNDIKNGQSGEVVPSAILTDLDF